MGDALASPMTEFITNDCPSGDTAYWCLWTFGASRPTLVANSAVGVPRSAVFPSEENVTGTAMSRSSAAT